MPQNFFQQRKQALLTKKDKSSIGEWDNKIKKLCNTINSFPQYYTTSSCSGRIIIMVDNEKKGAGLFKFVSHDLVEINDFLSFLAPWKNSNNLGGGSSTKSNLKRGFETQNLKFKQEPMILHVACETLEDANHLLKIAQKAGFKKVGILALNKRIIIEINGSEKIEFPLIQKGKLLVNEDFLKIVLTKSNKNLKKNWEKINAFEQLI